jgi:hypothetical protein
MRTSEGSCVRSKETFGSINGGEFDQPSLSKNIYFHGLLTIYPVPSDESSSPKQTFLSLPYNILPDLIRFSLLWISQQ